MAKDIDLTSQKWLDLIFEGKNTSYGAYVLREESSNRHLKALIIVLVVGAALIFLPGFIKGLIPESAVEKGDELLAITDVTLTDIKQEVPEENVIRSVVEVPPPPLLKKSIQYTIPEIAPDEEVADEDLMATQQELTDTKAAISVATVDGVEEGGVDIADLEDHKLVVQSEVIEPFSYVEIMPKFGNGDRDLLEWVNKHINYPTIARERGIQGSVYVRFVVNPDGTVSNVQVQRPLDANLDKEAIRVISSMPKWEPGKQNGVAVPVYFSLPVRFVIND
ncbi:MAG: energy transducer TonB [Dysgonamonadaceae bacterium]|nr:energy transducer TonB [Dysgonamonadaceae bacterium]